MQTLTFKDIFKDNSLRNMVTLQNEPMPHKYPTFYVSVYDYFPNELPLSKNNIQIKNILTYGNAWGKNSISSYIDINMSNEIVSERASRYIEYGPGSRSSGLKIEVTLIEDNVRVISTGWGSSLDLIYDGPSKIFLDYLKDHQDRLNILK